MSEWKKRKEMPKALKLLFATMSEMCKCLKEKAKEYEAKARSLEKNGK